MKVLLISANTEQMNMPVLPLGLACVAAAVSDAGYETEVMNLMACEDPAGIVKTSIQTFEPDIIGISVRNIDDQVMDTPRFLLPPVKELVQICKDNSGAWVVLGGAGYSIFPQSALQYLGADMGIAGDGEEAFCKLLDGLAHQDNIMDIPGLVLPDAGMAVKPRCPVHLDVFSIPKPGIHMNVPDGLTDETIWIPWQTRRGCPMNCSYCSTSAIEGRRLRKRSVVQAVEGLKRFKDAGFDHFFMVDNTFNFPETYARLFCDEILRAGLFVTWRCILYPGRVSESLVEKMAAAGCKEVSLGCESGADDILKQMNKRFSIKEVEKTSGLLKKYKIQQTGFLLLGGPGETVRTVEQSLTFMDSLDLDLVKITTGIRIYPHTDLHKTAIKEGMISKDDDLLFPKFYMRSGLKQHLHEMIGKWTDTRPHWIR